MAALRSAGRRPPASFRARPGRWGGSRGAASLARSLPSGLPRAGSVAPLARARAAVGAAVSAVEAALWLSRVVALEVASAGERAGPLPGRSPPGVREKALGEGTVGVGAGPRLGWGRGVAVL